MASGVVVAGVAVAHGAGVLGLAQAVRIAVGLVGVLLLPVAAGMLARACGPIDPHATAGPLAPGRLRSRIARLVPGLVRRHGPRQDGTPHEPWEATVALVRLSASHGLEFHARIRPRVAAVARHRLGSVGIDPSDREAVRAVLGELGAAIADPAPAEPPDRDAPGVPATELVALLRRLEELG
ncbi:MAG TPA: hypothetical protein VKU92_06545 [Acidimicrobiales bacterium]|nr:hypothetical protein [Acidimicrobiales bacterium]